MPGIFGPVAMADWLPLPTLRWGPVVAGPGGVAGVCGLWLPNFSNSGNDLPGHANPFTNLVPCDVVGDHPEERRQRFGSATSARTEELRDGLGVAA